MKPNTDSFELVAEGARENWLASRAAQDIGACVPLAKIPREELEALYTMIEVEFRVRDSKDEALMDVLIGDLSKLSPWDENQALEDGASMGDSF
jgi:hypothetical protein